MPLMNKEQALRLPALKLAFVGDTVCDLMVRTEQCFSSVPVREMHKEASSLVNAGAQAKQLDSIMHLLNEEEQQLVQRARNVRLHHTVPPAFSKEEYLKATAYEALMGYLFLTGQMHRAQKLFSLGCVKE
ncbi:MAG: ribonuclease III [Clostridia bacterium]|nr:ribonuclease III [Clostridia bacterium]